MTGSLIDEGTFFNVSEFVSPVPKPRETSDIPTDLTFTVRCSLPMSNGPDHDAAYHDISASSCEVQCGAIKWYAKLFCSI